MSNQIVPLPIKWTAMKLVANNGFAFHFYRAAEIERRLLRILTEWEDTRYDLKFSDKGAGIYCTAFVVRVLDELYGRPRTPLPSIPDDIGFHSKHGAYAGFKWFMRQYPTRRRLRDNKVQPGDIVIVGPNGGGPGHAMIVGPRENTLWHATGTRGVHYTGMGLPASYQFFAAYRFEDRERWYRET